MKEELITLETAKLAKEKGFDWNTCNRLYNVWDYGKLKEIRNLNVNVSHSDYSKRYYPAPTQSLLQGWLREKYNIIVLLEPVLGFSHIEFSMSIYTKKNIFSLTKFHVSSNKTYEEALEAGLIEGLKLIKGL
jgi:hypothetical protein